MPAHNHALRRKREAGVLRLCEDEPPRFMRADALAPADLAGAYGPFASRRHARERLRDLAREHRLCLVALGLEQRAGACFARQLRRCAGACVGEESTHEHRMRLITALAPLAIPRWPVPGLAVIYERSEFGDRTDAHVLRDWCWLGTAHDEAELGAMLEAPPKAELDIDIVRVLISTLRRGRPMQEVPRPLSALAA